MISLLIKVKPGAFKDEITIDAEGMLTIKIKERPIEGAANVYLLKFLAKEWDLRRADVVLEKGSNSRLKKIMLNINSAEFENIIANYKK